MGAEKDKDHPKVIPPAMRFLFGGLSGMLAICIVQPMDLVKTRLQLVGPAGKNMTAVAMAQEVVKKSGVSGLYAGLSAALFRQATYTTARLGSFNYLTDLYTASYGVPGLAAKLATGVTAGAIGALVGNPAEVALVRMTADGRLPPEQRRNYANVFNALGRMVREEGPAVLLRGASATVARAAVVNGAQLGTYAQARELLLPRLGDGLLLHSCAAMLAGLLTAAASQPLDIVKTRVQNAAKGGQKTSMLGVAANVVKKNGILGLWRGFLPTYLKMGPHTVFTFIFLEQFNAFYLKTN